MLKMDLLHIINQNKLKWTVFKMFTLTFPIYPLNILVKTEHQNVAKKQIKFHYRISYFVKNISTHILIKMCIQYFRLLL